MSDCIFCKIATGEIPSTALYEDDKVKVIFDAGPATLGHALVLPKHMQQTCLRLMMKHLHMLTLLQRKWQQPLKKQQVVRVSISYRTMEK